tara:strand:- start:236 stop:409 length:174 start_codon:yes stop_codon:yes gene_type:complete
MDTIEFLQQVYAEYCTKYNLPYVSCDEQEYNEDHNLWFKQFSFIWELAQENNMEVAQ